MRLAFRSPAGREDRAFIVSSWSSSYKSSPHAGPLWTDDYADIMHAQLERVLDRPEVVSVLACEQDDPDFFYGHIVAELDHGETPIIHYVYTKAPYRMAGVARGLFGAIGVNPSNYFVYTCPTRIVHDLFDKVPRARFDPNGIRFSKQNRRRAL